MDKLEMRDDSHAFGKATITVVGEHAIIYPIDQKGNPFL